MELSAQQLAAISGVPDAAAWLRPWVECGLVTTSETGTYRFTGGRLDPMVWQLAERRAELIAAFATWARRHPEAVLVAGGSAEPFRALQELARRQQAWRAVLALGAPLDVAYALGGHWDAWHASQQATLDAARALGDQPAEALALHQLGTHALCRGDLATARKLLGAALELRLALGQTAAAAVTRRNLATITDQPARRGFAAALGRIPMAVKVVAVLIPLLGSLAFVGLAQAGATPSANLNPQRLTFAEQAVDKASPPQIIRLGNAGKTALHVDNVALGGPNHGAFTLVDTSCVGAVVAGSECTATVVFTPAAPGEQQASLSWRIREIPGDMSSPLVGVGVAAQPVPAPAAAAVPAPVPAAVLAPAAVPAPLPHRRLHRACTCAGGCAWPAPRRTRTCAGARACTRTRACATPRCPAPADLHRAAAPVVVPAPVAVPVLVGQPQAEAAARLDALGLRVGQVERRSDPKIATGALIASDPQPGTPLPRGSAVDLVISTGVAQVAVPQVVGRSLAAARRPVGPTRTRRRAGHDAAKRCRQGRGDRQQACPRGAGRAGRGGRPGGVERSCGDDGGGAGCGRAVVGECPGVDHGRRSSWSGR